MVRKLLKGRSPLAVDLLEIPVRLHAALEKAQLQAVIVGNVSNGDVVVKSQAHLSSFVLPNTCHCHVDTTAGMGMVDTASP